MSTRKLNRRQRQRIQQIQATRRERAHERARRLTEELDDASLGPEETGLVIAQQRSHLVVENTENTLVHCLSRANIGPVVCGDKVVWQRSNTEYGVVSAVLPRASVLLRPTPEGNTRPIAANVDQLGIVLAVEPEPSLELVDQYLAAALLSGMQALILVNKSDLLNESGRVEMRARLQEFEPLGYTVIHTSSLASHDIGPARAALDAHTSVLVGQSGVGKSSLANRLIPDLNAQTGRLSESSGLGRHTTSTTTLYHLPSGGNLIDSPGVRQFRLWNLDVADVARGFVEFAQFLPHCRFNDCQHEHEPDCAILNAVAEGKISQRRFASYQRMVADARHVRENQHP